MAIIQGANQFSISGVNSGYYSFEINPAEAPSLFPAREYNKLSIIDGADVYQFPTTQNHLISTMQWPYVTEQIYDSLATYSDIDSDGDIQTSYFTAPGLSVSGLEIRVIDVRKTPLTATEPQRYSMELDFIRL